MRPMQQRDIEQLQTDFEILLPTPLRELLLDYPAALSALTRADESWVHEHELVADAALLTELNHEVRLEPIVDTQGNRFDWPEQLFVIGENGAGDYYCVDIEESEPVVIHFDQLSVEFYEIEDSLDEYVAMLMEVYGSSETETEPPAE